jgi:hypothetical protein
MKEVGRCSKAVGLRDHATLGDSLVANDTNSLTSGTARAAALQARNHES